MPRYQTVRCVQMNGLCLHVSVCMDSDGLCNYCDKAIQCNHSETSGQEGESEGRAEVFLSHTVLI